MLGGCWSNDDKEGIDFRGKKGMTFMGYEKAVTFILILMLMMH